MAQRAVEIAARADELLAGLMHGAERVHGRGYAVALAGIAANALGEVRSVMRVAEVLELPTAEILRSLAAETRKARAQARMSDDMPAYVRVNLPNFVVDVNAVRDAIAEMLEGLAKAEEAEG